MSTDIPLTCVDEVSALHGCLWVPVAATSLGLQALTHPLSTRGNFVDNLFGGIGL